MKLAHLTRPLKMSAKFRASGGQVYVEEWGQAAARRWRYLL